MNRRSFLAASALAAGFSLRLRRAFADVSVLGAGAPLSHAKEFREGLERARRLGKPLLVIVIPQDDAAKWERGRAFGEWINHGTPEQLAPLAGQVVVCAGVVDMGRYAPAGEPLMALVDPRHERPARALDGDLPRIAEAARDEEEAVVQSRVELLARLARETVPDPVAATAHARALYPKVVAALKDEPPPGSHWATTSGCCDDEVEATRAEKEAERRAEEEAAKQGIIRLKSVHGCGCGMGHVPEKSRRFLFFFARPDD
jgi:hypothetical protein